MSAKVELSGISHTYYDQGVTVVALDSIDLVVAAREIASIVGPSGCGKSTLLSIVAGLLDPTRGNVRLSNESPKSFRKNEPIGLVSQQPALLPWRTVRGNLELPLEIRHRGKGKEQLSRIASLLAATGLTAWENRYPKELSGGMAQRAALAMALVPAPRLLLLDEAFSAVDEITREQLWIDVSSVLDTMDSTVIMVTHSVREAIFIADKVVVLSRRPGSMLREVAIPFERPRRRKILNEPDFIQITEEIRFLLA